VRCGGNFPVTQSLEKSQLDRLTLKLRQRPDAFLQEMPEIIQNESFSRVATRSL